MKKRFFLILTIFLIIIFVFPFSLKTVLIRNTNDVNRILGSSFKEKQICSVSSNKAVGKGPVYIVTNLSNQEYLLQEFYNSGGFPIYENDENFLLNEDYDLISKTVFCVFEKATESVPELKNYTVEHIRSFSYENKEFGHPFGNYPYGVYSFSVIDGKKEQTVFVIISDIIFANFYQSTPSATQ